MVPFHRLVGRSVGMTGDKKHNKSVCLAKGRISGALWLKEKTERVWPMDGVVRKKDAGDINNVRSLIQSLTHSFITIFAHKPAAARSANVEFHHETTIKIKYGSDPIKSLSFHPFIME